MLLYKMCSLVLAHTVKLDSNTTRYAFKHTTFAKIGSCTRSRKTRSRMDTIPNGHHRERTQSRMDTIPNGHHPEWTPSRMDTIPNGPIICLNKIQIVMKILQQSMAIISCTVILRKYTERSKFITKFLFNGKDKNSPMTSYFSSQSEIFRK